MAHDHLAWPGEFTYCPHCATELGRKRIGDSVRSFCPECEFVHWRNPAVGAAVVVRDGDGRILLVKRGPGTSREGYWSMPAGFVNYGEEIREAAARELNEETGLVAEIGDVLHVASNFHDPAKLTVGVWFAGRVIGGELSAGDDAVEARFFALNQLPDLAFDTDAELLQILTDS